VLSSCAGVDYSNIVGESSHQVAEKKVSIVTKKAALPKSINTISHKKYAKGKFRLGPQYSRKGNSFKPKVDVEHTDVGYASWYGPGFHGKKTSNGARFDQNLYTAAHRTLPLPSVVKVTNLENGRTITVVVNDRGPFNNTAHRDKPRIIDLSKKAASTLGMMKKGVAKVKVDYLHNETKKLIAYLPKSQVKKAKIHFADAMDEKKLASIF